MTTMTDFTGYFASTMVLLTFMTKDMRLLRVLAIFSNAAFITYGALVWLPPVFCLHLIEGFSHFVTSMTAPIASGWSDVPGGPCTHWKAPPFHGARQYRKSTRPIARARKANSLHGEASTTLGFILQSFRPLWLSNARSGPC